MKRKSMTVGKIVLAGTLGLTAIGGSMLFEVKSVYAENSAVTVNYEKAAAAFMTMAESGKWEEAYVEVSQNLKSFVSKEVLSQMWTGSMAPYGEVKDSKLKEVKNDGVHTKVIYTRQTGSGIYELVLKFDKQGKLDEFATDLHYPEGTFLNPTYNHPERYTEKQVVIGEGAFSLPGILTLPKGDGPFPTVVLVHGSGPNDMDETLYGYKPFRDIAVGLASEGIAVLRYDKRTKAHMLKSGSTEDFTIQEETVLDANLAIEKLKTIPEIDHKNMYIFGHSQGAYALPLIVENDKQKDIKGGIAAAGPAGKFQDILLWQMEQALKRAEASKAPADQLKALEENLTLFQQQFALLNDPQYSKDNIPKDFQISPVYWWFDLRDFVPTELAKKQNTPLLVLQGGKDIQVPASELTLWQKALADRKDVEYKLYPNMFHMLGDYKADLISGMEPYSAPGNVSEELILDVAKWVKTGNIDESAKVDPTIYKDYQADQYWSKAFEWALNSQYIKGYEKVGLLKPYQPMTESQYLRVFFRYTSNGGGVYETMEEIYQTAKLAGLKVKNEANAKLSRGEAAVLLAQSFTKKPVTEKEAVQWLYDNGIVEGFPDKNGIKGKTYDSFKPNAPITRAHVVTMFHRIHAAGVTK